MLKNIFTIAAGIVVAQVFVIVLQTVLLTILR